MSQAGPRREAASTVALDPTVPNPAREWNFWVGGKDHFAADRDLAERFGEVVSRMRLIAGLTRRFLASTVSQLTADGIRQFLGNGHRAAHGQHPRGRPAGGTGVTDRLCGQ
jgi:hypothetical protein